MGANDDNGRDENSTNGKNAGSKALFAVLTAILAFLGAAGGTVVTEHFRHEAWRQNIEYEFRRKVFEKRLELIDRTVRVANSGSLATWLDGTSQMLLVEGDPDDQALSARMLSATDLRRNSEQLSIEAAAVMAQAGLFFGPKTRAAVEALGGSTWPKIELAKWSEIFSAMYSELDYGMESDLPQ